MKNTKIALIAILIILAITRIVYKNQSEEIQQNNAMQSLEIKNFNIDISNIISLEEFNNIKRNILANKSEIYKFKNFTISLNQGNINDIDSYNKIMIVDYNSNISLYDIHSKSNKIFLSVSGDTSEKELRNQIRTYLKAINEEFKVIAGFILY